MTPAPHQLSGSRNRKASSARAASRKKAGSPGDEHRRRDRRSSLKTCPDCSQEISYSNFARHMREKHSAVVPVEETPNGQWAGANAQPPFDCPACSNSYTRRCSLRRHQSKANHHESLSPSSSERTLEIPTDARSLSFDSDTEVGSPESSRKLRLEESFDSTNTFNSPFVPTIVHSDMERHQYYGSQETEGYSDASYTEYNGAALWGVVDYAHVVESPEPYLPALTIGEDHCPNTSARVPHQLYAEEPRSSALDGNEAMYLVVGAAQGIYYENTIPIGASSLNTWFSPAPYPRSHSANHPNAF